MGLNEKHALGRNQRFVIQPQLSTQTYPAFSIPDSAAARAPKQLTVLTSSMSYEQERKNRADTSQTRDYFERITGNKTVTWGCECHLLIPDQTSGAINPDWTYLMSSAMGSVASSGAGPYSLTYSLTQGQTNEYPMTLMREMNDVMSESVWGAVVEEMTISVAQGDDPKLSFSGTASDYAATATTTVNDASPNNNPITITNAATLTVNSVIKIGSDDGSSATGFQILSISGNDITLNEAPTSVSDGDAVIPYFDPGITTTSSSLINGISGQLDWGGTSDFEINSFSLTVKNNFKPIQEAFKAAVQDYVPGRRDITGEIVITGAKDKIMTLIYRYNFDSSNNVVARFGATSSGAEKMTITIAKPEFDFSEVTVPEAEEVTITLPFTALATTDTSTDALSIVLTTN
jgi:hypothetical protein